MVDIPRLNGAIRALELGKPAFATFASAETRHGAIDRRR